MSPRISIRLLAAQSDQRLVALAGEGHERAFEALVHRYRRPLLRYARRMRLSEARAEDVSQQAFMQAWIALSRGAPVQDVRAWLYRILHNVAVNAMRGPAAEAHGELTQAVQDRAGLAGVSNLERAIAVRDALGDVAALPRMQRQAIFLTAVDGQTHSEVADVLGVSEGALRGLLYRARATLRGVAAALTPPPVLAWACAGAGSSGPSVERLAELSGGAAATGMAGLLFKGAVVAVTAGAVATGAGVLSLHHRAAGHRAAHSRAPLPVAAASVGSSALLPASQDAAAGGLLSESGPSSRHAHSGARSHRGEHRRGGSSQRGEHHGASSVEGATERTRGAGHDALASDRGDGDGGRSDRSPEGEHSGSDPSDLRSGRDHHSSRDDTRSGDRSGSDSGREGSSRGRSDTSGASLADADSSPSESSAPSVPSEAQQFVTAATGGDDASASSDPQSGKGEG